MSCDMHILNKAHLLQLLTSPLTMSVRLLVYLAAVTVIGAVLDGSKVYRPTRTRLKTSSKDHHLELPSSLANQFKSSAHGGDIHIPVQTILASSRSKRDGETCGFDASIELEISSVSRKLYHIK